MDTYGSQRRLIIESSDDNSISAANPTNQLQKAFFQMTEPTTEAMGVRAIVALYRQFENVARNSDISLAQYRMMLYLRRGPKRAGVIAAASAVKKPTISAMLNSLRTQGWIQESTDPTDGRAVTVSLTKEGSARMARFEAELAGSIGKLAPPTSVDRLKAALARFYDGMAETQETRLREIEDRLLS